MEIDGSCLCGKVTWRATINQNAVGVCHCTQCQINGSSAFQWAVRVPASQFELLTGELKEYVKTAESGNERVLSFCPNCGTTVHGGNVGDTDMYSLRLGGCHQRSELQPKFQLWHRSAVDWAKHIQTEHTIETQAGLPR